MRDEQLNWKHFLGGVVLFTFLYGAYFFLSSKLYFTVYDLFSSADVVEINVYALWMPFGSVGVLIWLVCGLFTALRFKKQTNSIWSDKTKKLFNQIIGVFAALGLVFAVGVYQWLTSELDERGYVYSKEDSRLSAMGKHEVYIKKAD